jgi:hypothetical protein
MNKLLKFFRQLIIRTLNNKNCPHIPGGSGEKWFKLPNIGSNRTFNGIFDLLDCFMYPHAICVQEILVAKTLVGQLTKRERNGKPTLNYPMLWSEDNFLS